VATHSANSSGWTRLNSSRRSPNDVEYAWYTHTDAPSARRCHAPHHRKRSRRRSSTSGHGLGTRGRRRGLPGACHLTHARNP
jgi:hypothetical protein